MVFGHWELKTLIQRWREEGMVVFLPFFIYFARSEAIIDRSTEMTVFFIFLSSFRSACGNDSLCIW